MNRIRIQKVRGRRERRWLEVLPRLRVATWARRQGIGDPKSLPAWFVHSGKDDLGVRRTSLSLSSPVRRAHHRASSGLFVALEPVGLQDPDTSHAALRLYSWMSPPRTSRRRIREPATPSAEAAGSGGRRSMLRCGLARL